MFASVRLLPLLLLVALAPPAWAAEHPSLAKARALYNSGNYDGALEAAAAARSDAASADAAALVTGRAQLERYRAKADPADLAGAREALGSVRAPALTPRDQVDLIVGLGQSLYLAERYGAAAELFDVALSRAALLPPRDRVLLLEWWASAMGRDAQQRAAERRPAVLERVIARMEAELRDDPGSAPANYWLAAASRDSGDLDRAWHAAVAGWVRASLRPESAATVRADLDRLVTERVIPEQVRGRAAREQQDALATLKAEWDQLKREWP